MYFITYFLQLQFCPPKARKFKSSPERLLQEGNRLLASSIGNPSLATRTDPVAILNRFKASSLPLSMVLGPAG